MKISCQSCQAKYTIADEKVLGKIVKIRCKKCSSTIVINGNAEEGAAPTSARGSDAGLSGYESGSLAGDTWTVNVDDGDQRAMNLGEIVDAYRAGVINDETFCWKDGMNDWLPLREIDALSSACSGLGANAAAMSANVSGQAFEDPTKVQESPIAGLFPAGLGESTTDDSSAGSLFASAGGGGGAARRAGGRGMGGADLFGSVAQAGGEEEVMTSAPSSMGGGLSGGLGGSLGGGLGGEAPDSSPKLTGQRNENSVLFSLAALTSNGGPAPKEDAPVVTQGGGEASGLIDIRALASTMSAPDTKSGHRVDDIMNLAGGGAFTPALAPPVLGPAAPLESADYSAAASPIQAKGNKKGIIYIAASAAALLLVGGIVFMMTSKKEEPKALATAEPAAPTAESLAAPPAGSAAAPSEATPPTPAAAGNQAAPPGTGITTSPPAGGVAAKDNKPNTAAPPPAAAKESPPAATPDHTKTSTPTGSGGSLEDEIRKAAGSKSGGTAAPAAAAPASDQPFNMGEAKARLASIASSVGSCKKPDGPTGTGKVIVTFNPNGAVASAAVQGPPFQGTPTGACVASRFFGARVPPFSGSPFPVSKSFSIN